MCFAFYFIAENDFFSCLGFVFMQSFRLYHLFPLASRWEWMKCGIFCLGFICDLLLAIFVWRLFRLILFACCGFSSSLFCFHAHAMGFHAYFSAPTPSFRSPTYRLASGVCFLTRFPSKKHTPCGFLLASSLKNTLFPSLHTD